MKKLFENAKFGDLYRSKDGTLNVFCKRFHETDIVLLRQYDNAIGYFLFVSMSSDKNTSTRKLGGILAAILSKKYDKSLIILIFFK